MKKAALISVLILFSITLIAQEKKTIKLPVPQKEGGMPLMEALSKRQSGRDFIDKDLSPQQVSALLWAAYGYNRPKFSKRTVPSARNWQEFEIYVCTDAGIYRYDARNNMLFVIAKGDFRKSMGKQDYVKDAALNLIYVANMNRIKVEDESKKELYAAMDVGFIAQNVYLYCASEGLTTVVRASIDKDEVAKLLKLEDHKKIILGQSVGYSE